ncbi:DEAD/DEAH box helicase [Clostridium botulinum]|uniref:DEAD/DEAH box helicase n=1 Tax=Clostridium botulinum TaxID=1491 RepID=UPI001E5C1E3C|nr:DEAD/DEAH box helicase family protein [Clostridium botulinum]MCD3254366.1 DEAD/DEAH box helicase family protein [Clostridium botulinum C/D]MCD3279866.1 DEAD/DEAH box helicase family protein [Clostridium botulinum C/D]MCD3339597.1 DEAD/DEAH box helicase family protein [Clostridium botulinum C/D]MCD3357505.1 DEAD/DEAH box helicase family protein [Clostridium botulinum C/D]
MNKKLNLKWVSEVIGREYRKWSKGNIVKIQAQTGTGKTHFIFTRVVPYFCTKKILYICNRTNLKRQIKKDLLKQFNKEYDLTIEALDKITQIGNVTITSYHAIQNGELDTEYFEMENSNINYDLIVMDECHYIFSDASFNNNCRIAFDKLLKEQNNNAIKIFISATMDEINQAINFTINESSKNGWTYKTGIDYSYLDIKYFKNINNIVQMIKNDVTNDKWLIFVTNKNMGNNIIKNIGKDKATFVNAGTKNSKELNNIITKSKFDNKVLVTTKILDNGVNIKDELVKHIVIMAWDKTTFIQMLGRKRIDIENAENINLYINTRYKKSFRANLTWFEKARKEVKLYTKDRVGFSRKYDNDIKKLSILNNLFYKQKNGDWQLNQVGNYRLLLDIYNTQEIINRFKNEDEFAFIREQLEWLEMGHTFNKNNLIEDVINMEKKQDLEMFLKEAFDNDKRFDKNDFIECIETIIKSNLGDNLENILNKLNGRHEKRNKGMKIYNQLFDLLELKYVVSSKRFRKNNNLKTKWIITRI